MNESNDKKEDDFVEESNTPKEQTEFNENDKKEEETQSVRSFQGENEEKQETEEDNKEETPQNDIFDDNIHTDFNDERDTVKIYSGNEPPKTAPLTRKVSLTKLPPLAGTPESDAENEKLLQRYLRYGRIPDHYQRQGFIQYLQREKINALVQNDYVKASKMQDIITKIMQQMSEKDNKEKRQSQYQSTEEKLEQLNRDIEEVKNELKKDLKDEEYKHKDRKRQLLAQQDHEMDDFEAHWNDEDFLKMSFARPSATLLQLKTTERQLIITKEFHRAEEVKRKCEELEKQESIEAQRNAYQEMEKAQRKIESRHRMELEVCEQHYKKNINNIQRNHDIRMLALEARRSKLEKEIQEFKHPNTLNLPKFSPTPENIDTVITPRTAQRYSTYDAPSFERLDVCKGQS